MIIGLDIGGTHTDAVLLKDFHLENQAKVLTDKENLFASIMEALNLVMKNISPGDITRVVLSTTLSTNAVVENKLDRAAIIVSGGPGINPELFRTGKDYYLVEGALDHRGRVILDLDIEKAATFLKSIRNDRIKSVGIISKFSIRNPVHEQAIAEKANRDFPFISLGHSFSGLLNFPRRIATTFLNASVFSLNKNFITSVREAFYNKKIKAPIYMLKADGGTIEIDNHILLPVQTIRSGPAASIMGLMSLVEEKNYIGLDIGGTTTDISIFHNGAPLFEPKGITIGKYKTLIRGLMTKSIGIGGDSEIIVEDGNITVGPVRRGPSMAFGGNHPALTDALVVMGFIKEGNRKRAFEGISKIAELLDLETEETAFLIVDKSVETIYKAVSSLLYELNKKPVYTIQELLRGQKISPTMVVVVGGPAKAISSILQTKFQRPVLLPSNWEVANAIGAALARSTCELTLIADTGTGLLNIIEENIQKDICHGFTMEELKQIAGIVITEKLKHWGYGTEDFEFVEEQEFNMVRDFQTTGKNMRLKVQVKPGLIGEFYKAGAIC